MYFGLLLDDFESLLEEEAPLLAEEEDEDPAAAAAAACWDAIVAACSGLRLPEVLRSSEGEGQMEQPRTSGRQNLPTAPSVWCTPATQSSSARVQTDGSFGRPKTAYSWATVFPSPSRVPPKVDVPAALFGGCCRLMLLLALLVAAADRMGLP